MSNRISRKYKYPGKNRVSNIPSLFALPRFFYEYLTLKFHAGSSLLRLSGYRGNAACFQLNIKSLAESGVSGPTFETAWEQYRLHAFYAWIAIVITAAAGSSLQPEAIGRTGLK